MDRRIIALIIVPALALALIFGALFLSRPEPAPATGEEPVESGEPGELGESDGADGSGEAGDPDAAEEAESPDPWPALVSGMLAQIERQAQVDDMLLAEWDSGSYGFDEPLVVVDPYGMAPLAALALFTSDEPVNVSVHVPGKVGAVDDVDFAFDGYGTKHQIPIYGLYAGETNRVTLTATTAGGRSTSVSLEIQTDPLPPELSKNIIQTDLAQAEQYQPGFNFAYLEKAAFDSQGEVRWFYNDFVLRYSTLYGYNGNMVFAKGANGEGDLLIFEANALGKVLSVYYSPYGVHHDIASIDGRNLLVTGSRGATTEDLIYEVDVESGAITNILDFKAVLQRTRTNGNPNYSTRDWLHHNAIVYDEGSIIISARSQSAVVKLSWPEGKPEWILSDHIGWALMFRQYLLEPVGAGFEWPYGQHDPEILQGFDDDPDTIDILLFDNGDGRYDNDKELQRMIANNEAVAPEPFSRMVHYRINEREKTVEQVWEYGRELGETYFSKFRSGVSMLENGNRLGAFVRTEPVDEGYFNANFLEVDPLGDVIWEAYATSVDKVGLYPAYRLERLPLYTEAANDLRIDEPARNLIPEDMMP